MRKIGQILKSARMGSNLSILQIEEKTKIKSSFIKYLEEENWSSLPPFPTVLGFVKSLSTTLGIDTNMAVAVLKRDYPPSKISINPKPDLSTKFSWNPKLTFIFGVSFFILLILGYLSFQYFKFNGNPSLKVQSPVENQIVTGKMLTVFGTTDSDNKITVNNQPVLVDDNGKFTVNMEVSNDTKEIVIIALSRSGKETVVRRKIEVK